MNGSLDGFVPWFFSDFLPPILPWVLGIAVLVSATFWSFVVIGGMRLTRRWIARRRARNR